MIRNASDPAVRDVDAFAAAARGTVASANGTMVATVADVRAYDRVRAAVSATLLVVSTVAMVGVFLVPFFRGPVGATIFIVVLAASTAILLIFAALAFTTTGALGEGCTFATDKSARFIASVNADVGAKLQSFHATRSACLGPNATSLLDAASALGIVQTSFNISDMAATVINHYDFRQSTSIDLSSIVPQDLLNLDTNSIREKLQGVSLPPSLRQALFSLNASALASENEVLTSAAATLNLSISDGTVLSMVAADGGSAQPTTDDLAVLSAAIAQILGLQAAIRRDIQAVTELRTASIAAVETVAAALSNLQVTFTLPTRLPD
ncbi:hypothetical protein DFJ73DRAFT_287006 [Zopfochytrium polystomum]|nr:hypothetical protein DFJ73DRAFT_287006 [Zopfochytrium polystomum]